MSNLEYYKSLKDRYKQQLDRLNWKVKNIERSYNTLRVFNTTVDGSFQDFNGVISSKKSVLSEVNNIKKNSLIAQRYSEGIGNTCNSIGTKIVATAFKGFLFQLKVKLNSYINNLNDLNSQIEMYKRWINDLELKIEQKKLSS